MLNPFFLNGTSSEQGLLQSLMTETIQMHGVECYYLPRSYATTNTVIREVVQSEFNNAYPLEAYVESYDGYGGQGDILSKFGIQGLDDLEITISRERFESYISPLMKDLPDMELTDRPKEGDLIWFPLGDRLFEIKFVEHEQPFYQLKERYVYQLKCELFRLEDEVLVTNVSEIDESIEQLGHIFTLNMLGVGRTATATAGICTSGAINYITIKNMGGSYDFQPYIGISSSPTGDNAVGVASITNIYTNCNGEYGGKIAAINLINAGCGYTQAPWITISGGGGSGAEAVAGIGTGSVQFITITDGGAGYTTAPTVTFSNPLLDNVFCDSDQITCDSDQLTVDDTDIPGEEAARALSVINSAGIVTGIYVTYGGVGYQDPPTITIAGPVGFETGTGVGRFIFNEIVTGSTSGTTARVKEWNSDTYKLEVSIVDGSFTNGERITGNESGAVYVLSSTSEFDEVSAYADNDTIETKADSIIDFSETNPFGMP